MYLPTLTPLTESLLLVRAAWDAIFALHDVWFCNPHDAASITKTSISATTTKQSIAKEKEESEKKRINYLLTHLRDSLLPSWSYTYPSHPPLLTLFLSITAQLLLKLGIYTTVHLKDVLPIISSILLDPFILGTGQDGKKLFLEALRVLREVVLNAWMRVGMAEGGMGEVLMCIVGGWKAVRNYQAEDDEKKEANDLEEIRKELMIVAKLLVKAVEAVADEEDLSQFKADLGRMREVDESLGVLFPVED